MAQTDLEHLLSLSSRMVETRALQPLLEYAMNESMQLVGAERGYIVLLNADQSLEFRVAKGIAPVTSKQGADQISTTILQEVLRSGQPSVVKNAMSDPRWKHARSVSALKLRSVLCVPLISQGVSFGAIYVENRSVENRFDESSLTPLLLFASQAAVSIENARLYTQLEQQVQERTQALFQEIEARKRIEEELREANDVLKARNEELDAFAHTVAHDLKNTVALILGYANLLDEDEGNLSADEFSEYLRLIGRTAEKMNSVIENLLLLAGVRSTSVEMLPLDMASVVAESLLRLTRLIDETHAEITVPADWPVALGHASWVEEIWVNYISNACKYGGQPPRVKLGATRQANGIARFWVQDNGPGLTADEQDRLFLPFTRLHQGPIEGTGLGLSIVQRIIGKLGGEVGVESSMSAEHGSIFFFTLREQAPH